MLLGSKGISGESGGPTVVTDVTMMRQAGGLEAGWTVKMKRTLVGEEEKEVHRLDLVWTVVKASGGAPPKP